MVQQYNGILSSLEKKGQRNPTCTNTKQFLNYFIHKKSKYKTADMFVSIFLYAVMNIYVFIYIYILYIYQVFMMYHIYQLYSYIYKKHKKLLIIAVMSKEGNQRIQERHRRDVSLYIF